MKKPRTPKEGDEFHAVFQLTPTPDRTGVTLFISTDVVLDPELYLAILNDIVETWGENPLGFFEEYGLAPPALN